VARQRLGQHFLADAGWREEIAQAIRVSQQSIAPIPRGEATDSCWIEIGAGHGEMTEHLAATGASVYAVEFDPPLAAALQRFAKRFPNVTVVSADILETDIEALTGGRRVRIYGNLPYYITSPILHRLFEHADRIDAIHIVIQFEVAARIVAPPGRRDYGYLSVVSQWFTNPEIVFQIPPGAFRPPPKVASALVSFLMPGARAKHPLVDEAAFLNFVKECFAQKRKTLRNNLRARLGTRTEETLLEARLAPDVRAEALTVAQFAALFEMVRGKKI